MMPESVYADGPEPIPVNINGTVPGADKLAYKCGNNFNVEVFRELNKQLSNRVIPIVCDEELRRPLKRIVDDFCRCVVLWLPANTHSFSTSVRQYSPEPNPHGCLNFFPKFFSLLALVYRSGFLF